MRDDMQGLFASALEAYDAGKRQGCEDLFNHTLRRLSELSVEYEKANKVEAFHAAEMACGLLRSSKVIMDRKHSGQKVN